VWGFQKQKPDYERMSEDEVIRLAAGGDTEAFRYLMESYEGMVYRYLLLSTHSEADAADLSQETFISAWRALSSFRGDCRFSTWLCRIAENKCRDRARSLARHPVVSLTKEDPEEGLYDVEDPAEDSSPHASAVRQETAQAVRRAIAALPADQRDIIRLRDMEGLSYIEIAETLGLEMGTVKSRLARAREALKKTLTSWNIL